MAAVLEGLTLKMLPWQPVPAAAQRKPASPHGSRMLRQVEPIRFVQKRTRWPDVALMHLNRSLAVDERAIREPFLPWKSTRAGVTQADARVWCGWEAGNIA